MAQRALRTPRPVSALAARIPPDSWDSHMHVVDPAKYAISSTAAYTPSPHPLAQALAFESTLSIPNVVLVQPSIYGNDNSCMLDALQALGPRHGRAVVTFDPASTAAASLRAWHAMGVRGVRLNLKSANRAPAPAELLAEMRAYADAIRPLATWVLQLYVSLDALPTLAPLVPMLGDGVKLCIDHLGHPTLPSPSPAPSPHAPATQPDPYALPGFAALVELLRARRTWVKCSAAYRFEPDPAMPWTAAMVKELLRVAPDRVVFATDWPHTRFEGTDVEPFVDACLRWCDGDARLVEALFRRNAEVLWDVDR